VPAMAPTLPDELRAPFEIVFFQLLGAHSLSRASGLESDDQAAAKLLPGLSGHSRCMTRSGKLTSMRRLTGSADAEIAIRTPGQPIDGSTGCVR